jgi:hypothetical protein
MLKTYVLAALAAASAVCAQAQVQFTQIIFYPATPTAGTAFQADVPSWQCFNPLLQPFGPTTIQVIGNNIFISHSAEGAGSCFAAGDPVILKPLRINLGPLPAGEYQVRYTVTHYSDPPVSFSTTLNVLAGLSVPTMSLGGLSLLAMLVLAFAAFARPIARPPAGG